MISAPEPTAPWAPDHPVLELMRRRHAEGSRPGERSDGHSLALCVEGGGMRGVISAAMLGALEDRGLTTVFDALYGGSVGGLNAAYFLAGGLWRSLSIYYDELATARFADIRRPLRGRPILDVDWAFDTIVDRTVPLDFAAVLSSPLSLHVPVSLVDETRTEVVSNFASASDLREALRAGVWLPLATAGAAEFRGRRALDGGALVSHPSRLAIDAGHTHILSLSTQATAGSRPRVDVIQRIAAVRLERMRTGLGDAFMAAHRAGRDDRAALEGWRKNPATYPAVLDVAPITATGITRLEIGTGALLAAARKAYETMTWALDGRHRRVYPRFVAPRL